MPVLGRNRSNALVEGGGGIGDGGVLQAGREVGDEREARVGAAVEPGAAVRDDAVDEAVEHSLQRVFRLHGGQATDVAVILVPGGFHPRLKFLVALHVPIGGIGLIDVGAHVAAGRVPDRQHFADDGILVPRFLYREVGLGEAQPLQLGRRIVVEESAASAKRSISSRNCQPVAIDVGGTSASEPQPSRRMSSKGIRYFDCGSSSLRAGLFADSVSNIVISIAAVTRCQ